MAIPTSISHTSLSFLLLLLAFSISVTARPATFQQDFRVTWSDSHIRQIQGGTAIQLVLDQNSGCGFASKNQYLFGVVSMKIKLVQGDSAGTVTAFYMNSDTDNVRDELDFEFLGNRSGQPYTVQTNVYAHGKGDREQRVNLWFDPSAEFHTYSIMWNHHHVVFSVDDVPIRVYKNNEARGIPFPKFQPMGIYSTLWEADDWATRGGLEKIDWSKAPFYAYYKDFVIDGCPVPGPANCASNPNNWWEGPAYQQLNVDQARKYRWVRMNHMIYDYCTDKSRYPVTLPLLHENQNHYSELMDSKRSTGEEFVRGYPLSRNSLVPESRFFSSGSVISSSIYGNNNNSFALENQSTIPDAHTLPRFSGSLNSSFNASLPSTDISPMRRDWGFYTSRSSSLPRRSSSPFYSRSEQENLSRHRVPSDLVVSTGHITQSTTNNWEPSVPFRPSFDISSILSSPRSQYDPLLDSIEPTYGGVRSHQSSFGQGSTIQNFSHNQTNVNSISCYQQPQGGALDNHMAEAEPTLTSVANQQNTSSMSKEEKPDLDDNLRHPTDEAKHNKESKSLKLFRGSLVEFVKELLKPSWREGHLSKDAHNMIVKKAVDKVLSALQPHQIPSTTESINQYLSLSQPKLAKLVEGYVGKYGKS